jgi:hypothetical protein
MVFRGRYFKNSKVVFFVTNWRARTGRDFSCFRFTKLIGKGFATLDLVDLERRSMTKRNTLSLQSILFICLTNGFKKHAMTKRNEYRSIEKTTTAASLRANAMTGSITQDEQTDPAGRAMK